MKTPKCKKCKIQLKSGRALLNTLVGSPDFIGDKGTERGCTMSRTGAPEMVSVWKCPKCGYSITK